MRSLLVVALVLFSCLSLKALATVNKIKATKLFEGESILVKGIKMSSKSNPLTVSFEDGDGAAFGPAPVLDVATANKFIVTAPNVDNTQIILMKVFGGNVAEEEAELFPIAVFNTPDETEPSPGPPGADGDINANNVAAKNIVLEEKFLNADDAGNLKWNNKAIVDENGAIVTNRVTLDGIAIEADANDNLTWNSHIIAAADGGLTASSLVKDDASLNLTGTSAITLNTVTETATVSLPPSGVLTSILRAEYDFGVDGGVTGTITLRNGSLPEDAVVIRAWYEVLTTFTSASDLSDIGISIPGDDVNGILAAISISDGSNPWDAGIHACIQNGSPANFSNKASADKDIELSVAGEAITAGKANFYFEYVVMPD